MSSKKAASSGLSSLRLVVAAGKATPTPPVGPALGQRGIRGMEFCKLFNDRTANLVPGTPIPVRMLIKPDRTYTFTTHTPQTSWLLKQAAGIEKGASKAGEEVVGQVSVKAIYEIAKIKQRDLPHLSLEELSRMIAGSTRSMGIKVVM
ncbi:mitochondrial ribosomal protein L11 [Catenaria anguillulae PL171]|uniref:Large ribosomal subunit protein uL11m n=1 Tax=Catenaria anguillulae PL171 TaxID=765915 RepID=A0A1Y2HV78_9FUNG|nr:mitochondrial ribosomal protein L11 [Catenaria anguillulae PL171]